MSQRRYTSSATHLLRATTLGGLAAALALAAAPAFAQWPQWGGPTRDFKCAAGAKLADAWPADGPKKLWSRDLGDGYSTIAVDEGRLFTMYRKGNSEVVIAMNADDGQTLWEYAYDAPLLKGMDMSFGAGPNSTPLIVDDRLFTVGITAKMHCLDKKTGKVLWKHDLLEEFGATHMGRGYSASPMAYKDTVIVPAGGESADVRREIEQQSRGQQGGDKDKKEEAPKDEPKTVPGKSVIAFHQKTGSIVWSRHDYSGTFSSPILIQFKGKDQLAFFMGKEIAGMDPTNGDILWSHPHRTQFEANISTPVWAGDNRLFCSSAYSGSSRAIELVEENGKIGTKELWNTRKMRIHHGNALALGDYIYGSSGDFGPAFLMCMNIKTGEMAWRERGFSKANCLYADGKMILLDEDGNLALATATPQGLKVLSKCQLLQRTAWTAPTLVGTKLYIRDNKKIMALDLG